MKGAYIPITFDIKSLAGDPERYNNEIEKIWEAFTRVETARFQQEQRRRFLLQRQGLLKDDE